MRLKALPPIQGPEAAWTGLRWKRWRKCRYGWIKKSAEGEGAEAEEVRKEKRDKENAAPAAGKVIAQQEPYGRDSEAIRQFRRTIAGYYQMEEENVEIGLED